jgi:multiple sugar transport system ATP-binding protein
MGRAIVRNPQVFLFDEPLSNLDAQLRNQVRTDIKKLHQQVRTTSIYVTHDQVEAMTLGDRIVLLRDGRIEQVGTPMQLYANPTNRFVAGFIGSPGMNFIPARLEGTEIVLPWMRLPCPALSSIPSDRRIDLGVRPDDVLTGAACMAVSETLRFWADVKVVEPMGPEALVLAQADNVDLQIRVMGRLYPHPGSRLLCALKPADLHVFDATTGASLRQAEM